MRVLAIDPGPTGSAFVLFDGARVIDQGHYRNDLLLERLIERIFGDELYVTVIEQIESMGMSVGASVFETVFWSGRFAQASRPFDRVTRRAVKLHLCATMRAKDPNIRQALLDRFGGASAVGTKANRGPLYGVSSHRWAALAVAVTWFDLKGAADGETARDGQEHHRGTRRAQVSPDGGAGAATTDQIERDRGL